MTVDDVQSALDSMAASMGDTKRKASLTPVGTERPQAVPGAAFPNDMPTEVMRETVRDLRRVLAHVLGAIDALETALGAPVVESQAPVAVSEAKRLETKAVEAAGDAKAFAADYASKQQAAQVAAFTASAKALFATPPVTATGDWECPTHGQAALHYHVGERRQFWRCKAEGCREFQR